MAFICELRLPFMVCSGKALAGLNLFIYHLNGPLVTSPNDRVHFWKLFRPPTSLPSPRVRIPKKSRQKRPFLTTVKQTNFLRRASWKLNPPPKMPPLSPPWLPPYYTYEFRINLNHPFRRLSSSFAHLFRFFPLLAFNLLMWLTFKSRLWPLEAEFRKTVHVTLISVKNWISWPPKTPP